MNNKIICLPFLVCLTELLAQPVEYEFKNSEDRQAFQELQKTDFYAQYKKEIDELADGIVLWKHIDKDIMILVEDSGSGLFCFAIKFYVRDDDLWRYALELNYSTGAYQFGPDKVAKVGKLITVYTRTGDVIISTELPAVLFSENE